MVAFIPATRALLHATKVYYVGMEKLAPGAVWAPFHYGVNLPTIQSGGITQSDVYSPFVTSTNGTLSPRGNGSKRFAKKQIRSTSHYYSRRKKYDYPKKRRYRY